MSYVTNANPKISQREQVEIQCKPQQVWKGILKDTKNKKKDCTRRNLVGDALRLDAGDVE
jgi:hypothetical protein